MVERAAIAGAIEVKEIKEAKERMKAGKRPCENFTQPIFAGESKDKAAKAVSAAAVRRGKIKDCWRTLWVYSGPRRCYNVHLRAAGLISGPACPG